MRFRPRTGREPRALPEMAGARQVRSYHDSAGPYPFAKMVVTLDAAATVAGLHIGTTLDAYLAWAEPSRRW